MTEDRQTDPTAGAENSTGAPVEGQTAQTVEEVEAIWKGRLSGKDRAHNAETEALRAQIEALKAQPAPAPVGETPEQARVRELERDLQTERTARQVEVLRNKFPTAAAHLGEAIIGMDEAKIAGLEAALDGVAPANGTSRTVIDPNAAPRRVGAPAPGAPGAKPLNEKTKDELLADLKRVAPTIQEEARQNY